MRVDIQVQLDTALDLHKQLGQPKKGTSQGKSSASELNKESASELNKEIEKMGLKIEPIHPGQTHPLLAPYFMIEVPDRQTAERVIDRLTKNKIVEAAYLRPEEAAP